MALELFKKDAEGIPIMSPSQINLLMMCPKKWRLRYVDKMKDSMGIDAKLGNFTHEALEIALKATMAGAGMTTDEIHRIAYEAAIAYFTNPDALKELRGDDAAMAMENSDRYAKTCADLAATAWNWFKESGLTAVSVEQSVDRIVDYMGNKIKIGGRLDLLARRPDGTLVIVDWKTASKAPSKSIKGAYVMDRPHIIQQLIYAKCLIEQGHDVKRVATLKITKTRVPTAYYADVEVTPGMLTFSEGIIQSAIQMVYNDILPPNPVAAGFLCSAKYCFAYDICPGSSKHIAADQEPEA